MKWANVFRVAFATAKTALLLLTTLTFHDIILRNKSEDSCNYYWKLLIGLSSRTFHKFASLSGQVLFFLDNVNALSRKQGSNERIISWCTTEFSEPRKLVRRVNIHALFIHCSFIIMFFNLFSPRSHFPLVNQCPLVKGKLWRYSYRGSFFFLYVVTKY